MSAKKYHFCQYCIEDKGARTGQRGKLLYLPTYFGKPGEPKPGTVLDMCPRCENPWMNHVTISQGSQTGWPRGNKKKQQQARGRAKSFKQPHYNGRKPYLTGYQQDEFGFF
jgi:hypothetical protein